MISPDIIANMRDEGLARRELERCEGSESPAVAFEALLRERPAPLSPAGLSHRLLICAAGGLGAGVEFFLSRGADPSLLFAGSPQESRIFPLHAACSSGNPAAIGPLLSAGGSVLSADPDGAICLARAAGALNPLAIDLIASWPGFHPLPAQALDRAFISVITDARNHRLPRILELAAAALIRAGASVDAICPNGDNALLSLCRQGDQNANAIDLLLNFGAHPNLVDNQGRSPIAAAMRAPSCERVLVSLLAAGANPMIEDENGHAPGRFEGPYANRPAARDILSAWSERRELSSLLTPPGGEPGPGSRRL